MERLRKLINTGLAVVLVCAGAGMAARLVATRPVPPQMAEGAPSPGVLAFEVIPQLFDAPVLGYGTIRPRNRVRIIPQVSGMLTAVHSDLAVGKFIPQGEVLFEIDRRSYESQVLQVEADIKMLEVQLKRHEQRKQNLTAHLENSRDQTRIAERDLEAEEKLREGEARSDAQVDVARQKLLSVQDVVLGYESQLALIPHQIDETNARLEVRRAQLADAQRKLDNTKIICPFDARVDLVSARTSQVVVANFAIAALTDVSALELSAALDPSELQWAERKAYARMMGGDLGEPPSVTVSWTLHDQRYSWTGRISRLERHDELTRTARVVVEIPQSLEQIRAIEGTGSPVLSVGMFCSASIPAEPLADALVLPRSAIHEDNVVYVFQPDPGSPDGRTGGLALRRVPMLRNVNDQVLVDFVGRGDDDRLVSLDASVVCELGPGELVIASPLPRAVAGMKLRLRTADLSASDPVQALTVRHDHTTVARPVQALLAQIPFPEALLLPLAETHAGDW